MPPRTKRRDLSPQLRIRILELHDIGWSLSKIAARHELPKSTVQSTIVRARERGESQLSKPRCGAPRVFTEDQRDEIYEAVERTPDISAAALQAQIAPNASLRSIRQLIQEMNLRRWTRAKEPAPTKAHA